MNSKEVQYLTFYRLTEGTKGFDDSLPTDENKIVRKTNSILVNDKEFFEAFDYDEVEQ